MSKARVSLVVILDWAYESLSNQGYPDHYIDDEKKDIQELVDRDEPKPVNHLHPLKSFGKCHVCNKSVHLIHHRNFCGECGTRLIWGGKEVI